MAGPSSLCSRSISCLAEVVGDDGYLATSLGEGADARAVGDELARLLCAFRGEYARVRRDAACLLERNLLSLEDSRLRLHLDLHEEAPSSQVVVKSTSASRMRDLRARREAARLAALASSNVTVGDQ